MSQLSTSSFNSIPYFEALKSTVMGRNVLFFNSLDSTNSFLKRVDGNLLPHGLLCITDNQTAGRGQYQRSWISEPGKNLTFSILLKPGTNERAQLLLQVCALSLVDAVLSVTGVKLWMKWPNDLYANSQKICGILAESTFTGKSLDKIVIGMGLNVNDNISINNNKNAVSLKKLLGIECSRENILAAFMNRLDQNYERWLASDQDLIRQINQLYPCLGKTVQLTKDGVTSPETYRYLGVDIDGYPLFLDESLSLKKFVHEQIRFGGL